MKHWLIAAMLSVELGACAPNASSERGVKPNDVQIVAQWVLPDEPKPTSSIVARWRSFRALNGYFHAEDVIEKASGGLYFEDGNDVGGGTFNVYLYTDRVADSVSRLVQLNRTGKIPNGLRVGVAQYKDTAHSDWTYKPVYPPGLSNFDIAYGRPIPSPH